ncbi:phosphotransferase [Neobacillus vireti]|uniref:phosphotransferase n=1 Tax=Neobacillus vireti TaxID=220686 RepID=UPI002FFEC0E6
MELPADIVFENGELNDDLILKREPLYKGMNGRFVERFFLTPTTSFIFKPLTNNGQLGKEVWIHQHILPRFPPIYPKIISYKISKQPEGNWMIFEDLGVLTHVFDEKSVLELIKWVAWWHSLPVEDFLDVPAAGLKPQIADIITEVRSFRNVLPGLGLERTSIDRVYSLLEKGHFSARQVLSHGDLHIGNFSIVDNVLKILDWEHAHLNLPYWDLYHLMDMSHPLFPKITDTGLRQKVLEEYISQVHFEMDGRAFMKEYYLFSAVFSIWMIALIQKDLQASERKWPEEQLKRQLQETLLSLRQCAEALDDGE